MSGMSAASPRRRSSLVASPTPQSPSPNSAGSSGIPRPQSAAGRYRSSLIPAGFSQNHATSNSASVDASSSSSGDDSDKGQVRVVLRLRPSEPEDPNIPSRHRAILVHPISQTEVRVSVDPATLASTGSAGSSSSKRHPTFTFDRVLGEPASQVDLFNSTARDRVEEFLKGFNVTFLAYGQTSSGKSYSMGTTGEDSDYLDFAESSRAGLIPRTVDTIFRRAEEMRMASGPGATWECRVSFLELYNEDLIDLLAHSSAPTNVSIRENQDGRIVWSGVREIKVQNVSEVMTLLHEGSNRRRTGETNMNQTSSRSHAIFSLILVQSRRAEAQDDIRSATPSKRPMSVMGLGSRSTTPQFSRVPPSSFGKLGRPNSMHVGNSSSQDDMVVITSKFNMVDLAGSERLKRTGAQAERMKEGISINSGLLALGNVISALSEPAKARGHVPYRDSKLTRLLQDSIGGNAMTTMIACISPLEYNISETINTINYASRARKIKNSVSKNQSEVGWDDIDYLRSQVTKLRAKIASADSEPRSASTNHIKKSSETPVDDDALQRKVMDLTDKLTDLEDEFSHLQDQYFQKCREIVALSDPELLEDDKLRQFNETIEPVVLEYEKVVTSLNGQIAELRAEAAVQLQSSEDQAAELSKTHDRLTEHESYVQELQGRLSKLSQRNDSSEAYIRDLETKFRNFTDNDDRQTEVITSLTQEIQQLKTESSKSNAHIAELEQRIAAADTRNGELGVVIERFETESETREKQVEDLENRLAMLDNQQSVTHLLEELETRDRKIEDLETRIQQQHESTRELAVVEAKTQTPSTPPDTPPVLRTIVEDSETEVDALRKENQALMERLHEVEMRYEQLHATPEQAPATPTLDPPSEQDEELEDEHDLTQSPSKRGSTGESSESDTTLETPKLASRTVSPQIHDDPLNQAMTRSPFGTFRAPARGATEPRLLRPLSLSQGLSTLAYSGSPRYSWSAPSNGMLSYERSSPKFERSPKRQSMPFDSKPVRSVQSLEIDISLLQKAVADRDTQLRQREVEIKYLKKTLENNNVAPTTQINQEEAIERLRKDHSDQLNKILDEHQRGMNALANEHHSSVGALRHQLEQTKLIHTDELVELKESHKGSLDELTSRHAKEVESSHDLKSALDAAWEELSATGRRHQIERDNLVSTHHSELAELEQRHTTVLAALQSELTASAGQLKAAREELVAASEGKLLAERQLADRPDLKDAVPLEEHNIVVSAMEEMEKALTSAEDEKRQLKMKTDQVRFELSKIRDEHEIENSSNLTKIADLEKRCTSLTADNTELKQDGRNRDSKTPGTDRSSRAKLPPIGPPPTAPLPPLPAGREAVLSPTPTSSSQHRGDDSPRSSQHGSHDVHSPRPDSTVDNERLVDLETKLAAKEKEHAQFEKDLMEYRKNNSKLKVRVDDANRELTELKRERDALRRDVVEMKNELADAEYERIADKQRFEGARAEAAQYRAKLDRMVDAKVSKRSDQKLKCF